MIRVLLVDDQELVRSGFRIILESEPDLEVVAEAANGADAVELAASLAPDVICMDVEMPVMDGIEASRRILKGVGGAGSGGSANSGSGSGAEPDSPDSSGSPSTSPSPSPSPSVLILTTFGHENYLFDALAAGVSGFLLKTSRAEQLIDAVRTLASGGALLGADVTRAVIERVAHANTQHGAAALAGRSASGSGAETGAGPGAGSGAGGASTDATDDARAAMERAGLTERERDVLALLAEGKSNAEIARELFLGEATVKTHVSNLLQKLGVRDRIQAVVWAHTRARGG